MRAVVAVEKYFVPGLFGSEGCFIWCGAHYGAVVGVVFACVDYEGSGKEGVDVRDSG